MESFSFPQQRLLSPRQTDSTLLDLTFCVRLDSLLGCCSVLLSVVGNFLAKFETGGQTSSYVQTFAALLGQQRWEWLRPFARGFSFNRRTKYSGNGWGGGGRGGGRPYFPFGNIHYQKDVMSLRVVSQQFYRRL